MPVLKWLRVAARAAFVVHDKTQALRQQRQRQQDDKEEEPMAVLMVVVAVRRGHIHVFISQLSH